MKIGSWRLVVLLMVAVSAVCATAALAKQTTKQGAPERAPTPAAAPGQVTPLAVGTFDGKVEPVAGSDDKAHLAYELRLTNLASANLTLERVRVLDPTRDGRVVDEPSGDEIDSRVIVFGGAEDKTSAGQHFSLLFLLTC